MPAGSGEVTVYTKLHPQNWWILVPLEVGGTFTFDIVLDTGSPLSALSIEIINTLLVLNRIEQLAANRYILRDLWIQGQPIPDLGCAPAVVSLKLALMAYWA